VWGQQHRRPSLQQAAYLVDRISALGAVAEEVARKDDPGDVGSTALFPFVSKLPCHHVHQQLGTQQAFTIATT
jgi:hypothetical protein